MGVTVIPTDYGGLAQSLGTLATATAKMVNPFHDLQMSMRNEIAQNPELAQHLSDLEDSAPGTLDRMGLGKLGDAIAKIPPSNAQIVQKGIKPALEQRFNDLYSQGGNENSELQNTAAQTISPTKTSLPQQGTQQSEAATAAAGVPVAQVRGQAAGAFGNELQNNPDLATSAGATVVTGYRHGDFMSGVMGEQATRAAHNIVQQSPGYDLSTLAHKFAARTIDPNDPEGQMSPDEQQLAQALSIDPGTSKYFTDAVQFAHQGIISDRMADRYSTMYGKMGSNQAAAQNREIFMGANRAALSMHRPDLTPEFQQYYTDPKFQQHISDVINGKAQPANDQEGDFASAIRSNGLVTSSKEGSALSNSRMKLVQEMTATDKDGNPKVTDSGTLNQMVQEYNNDSQTESSVTGQPALTARVATTPNGLLERLGIKDATGGKVMFEQNGQPVDPGTAAIRAGGIGLQRQIPGLSQNGQRLLTQLKMNPHADIDGSIAQWAKALSPTDAAVIRSQIGR